MSSSSFMPSPSVSGTGPTTVFTTPAVEVCLLRRLYHRYLYQERDSHCILLAGNRRAFIFFVVNTVVVCIGLGQPLCLAAHINTWSVPSLIPSPSVSLTGASTGFGVVFLFFGSWLFEKETAKELIPKCTSACFDLSTSTVKCAPRPKGARAQAEQKHRHWIFGKCCYSSKAGICPNGEFRSGV